MRVRSAVSALGLVVVAALTATGAQPPKGAPVKTDGLPEGAVARLGQTRLRHAERPTCVAFAPDGKTFYTGAEDGTVRAWATETGDLAALVQRPALSVVALKMTHDGTRLAVQHSTESVVRLLDPATLRERGTVPVANKSRFDFSADGKLLLSADASGNAVVTEVDGELPKVELAGADKMAFRPDGKAVVIGDTKGNVTVYLVTGGKPTFALKGVGTVYGFAYSPDGKRLAVGARNPEGNDTVRVYEGANEKPVAEVKGMNVVRGWVAGGEAVAVGNGTEVGVYDLKKQELTGPVRNVAGEFAVSPDGLKLVATGNGGLRVRLWDIKTGKQLQADNDTFPEPALMVAAPGGRALFMLTGDTAYLWELGGKSAREVGKMPAPVVAAAHGGGVLAVATADAVLLYEGFDASKPLPAKPTHTFDKSTGAKVLALSPDGKQVAWAVEGGKVTVASTGGKRTRTDLPVTTTTVMAMAFKPNGEALAVLGRDTFLRLWSFVEQDADVKELWKARIGRGQKAALAFSPDGKYIAAASLAQVPVFTAGDGQEVFKADRYSEDGYAQHVAFTPDSRLLVLGSSGTAGRVEAWELASRGLVRKFSTGFGGISRLCVFPDGTRVASAGAEEAVTVWDLSFKPAPGAKAADPDRLWEALDSDDAAAAYPAVKQMAATGDAGVAAIATGAKDLVVTQRKINGWVEDLGSETFAIREVASKELLALGARALPAVSAATRSEDAEVRKRAMELHQKLRAKGITTPEHGLSSDSLRLVRAVQALEEINTAKAKALLADIAAAGGPAADEAKAALKRLKK